jgi:hypothetical protein
MDKTGNGVVDMEDVVGTYDASRHPLVTNRSSIHAILCYCATDCIGDVGDLRSKDQRTDHGGIP